jgi:hypothetical protein
LKSVGGAKVVAPNRLLCTISKFNRYADFLPADAEPKKPNFGRIQLLGSEFIIALSSRED